jgi:hypothetical protein
LYKLVFRHALALDPIAGFNPDKNGLDVVSKQTKIADTFLRVENVEALPGFDGTNRPVLESAQEPGALICAGITDKVVVGLGRDVADHPTAGGTTDRRWDGMGRVRCLRGTITTSNGGPIFLLPARLPPARGAGLRHFVHHEASPFNRSAVGATGQSKVLPTLMGRMP